MRGTRYQLLLVGRAAGSGVASCVGPSRSTESARRAAGALSLAFQTLIPPIGTIAASPAANLSTVVSPIVARSTQPSTPVAISIQSPAGSTSVAPGVRNIQPIANIDCAGSASSTFETRIRAEKPAGDGSTPPNACGIAATVQDAAA